MIAALIARREIGATVLFALAGLVGLVISPAPWAARLPNALFYAVLVVNTYYSVRFFDSLPPADRDERVVDGALAVVYVLLSLAIGSHAWFALASTLLFAIAIVKYALLTRVMDRRDILNRKMAIDATGLVLCAATLAGTFAGYSLASAWVQAIVFILANVYLLAIRPMYALPSAGTRR